MTAQRPIISMGELGRRVGVLATKNRASWAARIRNSAAEAICQDIIAAGLSADATDEEIELALLRQAVRHANRFTDREWSALKNLGAFDKLQFQGVSPRRRRRRTRK